MLIFVAVIYFLTGCGLFTPKYDTVIKGGLVYDGTGQPAVRADIGIRKGQIAAIRD